MRYLPREVDPLVYNMSHEDPGSVSYSEIWGLSEQIRELREVIELPLTNPELFQRVGIIPPKGCLLRGGGFSRGGSRGGRGGFGGRGGGRGGFQGGGRGGFNRQDYGPPEYVVALGEFMHPCEDDIVCRCVAQENKVPYFNAPVYLENKEQIGKVDEIFGQLRDFVSFLLFL
ncbi:hypothetical protein AAFF_G00390870 [Aldrovandia affinis]|uniref:H/ACA ribonucleoprotein complex subunit n=1 Tax=Aldrovandia affinis TaxID=143900 RepID=A0AAD7R3Y6_9TELE|nr:hypothetical protein AAFF_G00390870 [Aldrovandia affinis]